MAALDVKEKAVNPLSRRQGAGNLDVPRPPRHSRRSQRGPRSCKIGSVFAAAFGQTFCRFMAQGADGAPACGIGGASRGAAQAI